jgi:hypothetical protein
VILFLKWHVQVVRQASIDVLGRASARDALRLTCYMKFDELRVYSRRHVLVSALLLLVLLSLFTMFDNVAFFEKDIF